MKSCQPITPTEPLEITEQVPDSPQPGEARENTPVLEVTLERSGSALASDDEGNVHTGRRLPLASPRYADPTCPGTVRTLRGWPLYIVIAVMSVGIVLIVGDYWRRGTTLIGAALVLGAVLRAVLPTEIAGILAVRSRLMDVITMGLIGASTVVLSLSVPVP